jgi:ABC-type branched-subunit amino acid transport system ATPase component
MTTKELAIQTIRQLPDSADWMQIEERIHFVAGLRKGLYELDHGEGIAHNVVKEEFAEWLSK